MNKLKGLLSQELDMKHLGPARKILGMEIKRDIDKEVLYLSQKEYIKKIVKLFGQNDARAINTPIGAHFKLRSTIDDEAAFEAERMKEIPYANATGSIMYAMVSTSNKSVLLQMPLKFFSRLKSRWIL